MVEFEVQDSGSGISDEDKKALFQEFGIGKDNILNNKNGSGLGLSICKKIVRAMGGDIHI